MKHLALPERFRQFNPRGLCEALDKEPEVSVRLNPLKMMECEWSDCVPWCASGRYLEERPNFTIDPRHAAGGYYVQEASSMVVGEILSEIVEGREGLTVVDLCAAPGGKSTHVSSVVGSRGVVIANEVIKQRAGILAQNIVRWGEGNSVVTSAEVEQLSVPLEGLVDVLVVDVPCSGEGMFRKDNASRGEWSVGAVELCAARGRKILFDAKKMLREGGYLIFSTCTFNRVENEGNVRWLIESGDFEQCNEYSQKWGNSSKGVGSHFYPNEVRGEGLYVAVLRYIGEENSPKKYKAEKRAKRISKYSTLPLLEVEIGGRIYGYSEAMLEVVERLRAHRVQILYSGVEFGELIREELKPAHAYALYSYRNRDIYPSTEVSLEVALEYLRKGALPAELFSRGVQVVSFSGLPLGFVKGLGTRVNNMYPTAWRIVNY